MEKQRTPLATGIKKINSLAMDDKTIRQCVNILTELLPTEREAFEKAFDSGDCLIDDGCGGNIQKYKNKKDYFDQTFTQS